MISYRKLHKLPLKLHSKQIITLKNIRKEKNLLSLEGQNDEPPNVFVLRVMKKFDTKKFHFCVRSSNYLQRSDSTDNEIIKIKKCSRVLENIK